MVAQCGASAGQLLLFCLLMMCIRCCRVAGDQLVDMLSGMWYVCMYASEMIHIIGWRELLNTVLLCFQMAREN